MPPQTPDNPQQPFPPTPAPAPDSQPLPGPQVIQPNSPQAQGYAAATPAPQPVYNAPPQQPQPMYGAAPQAPVAPQGGNGLAIAGLVLAFLAAPIGLIVSIIALMKHKTKSAKTLSIVGIAVSAIGLAIGLFIVFITMASVPSLQSHAHDTKIQTDLQVIQSQLESAYAQSGSYPTLAQLNDSSWRSTNMKALDPNALSPNSSVLQLVSGEPTVDAYSYAPTPTGCDASDANPCKSYNLTAQLSNDQKFTVSSLN